MRVVTIGGFRLQVDQDSLFDDNTPRTRAAAEAALRELSDRDLIEPRGTSGDVLAITQLGYDLADELEQSASRGNAGRPDRAESTRRRHDGYQRFLDAAIAFGQMPSSAESHQELIRAAGLQLLSVSDPVRARSDTLLRLAEEIQSAWRRLPPMNDGDHHPLEDEIQRLAAEYPAALRELREAMSAEMHG